VTIEQRLVKAGAVEVSIKGQRNCFQLGSKLIRPCGKKVYVGYAHNPDQMGVLMSVRQAISL
jgi:UDP-N-acetylmuramyl tripeptide synthase